MSDKSSIPVISFWDAVGLIPTHFFTARSLVYIFSNDKILYNTVVKSLEDADNVEYKEKCRVFVKKEVYGSIDLKPIRGTLCSMQNVRAVYLYGLDYWTDDQWEDFVDCKLEKFKDNIRTEIYNVEPL